MKIDFVDPEDPALARTTYYIRDASGNIMANYSGEVVSTKWTLHQTEVPLYGSSRLGVYKPDLKVNDAEDMQSAHFDMPFAVSGDFTPSFLPLPAPTQKKRDAGRKYYELSDHLGNVRVVVGDRRAVQLGGGGYHQVTFAGNGQRGNTEGTLTTARLDYPDRMVVDSEGTAYVISWAQSSNHFDIRVLDADQNVTSTISIPAALQAGTNRISSIALYHDRYLFLGLLDQIYVYDVVDQVFANSSINN